MALQTHFRRPELEAFESVANNFQIPDLVPGQIEEFRYSCDTCLEERHVWFINLGKVHMKIWTAL